MRTLFFLLSILLTFQAQAVVTRNCPDEIKLQLSGFKQGQVPTPSEDNPELPFAYIELKNLSSRVETLTLTHAAHANCSYRSGETIYNITLDGSLREGAVKPAVLKAYFSYEVGETVYDYIGYAPIEKLTKDKTLVVASKMEIYFRGEECSFGECIPDHIKIGSARSQILHQEVSCMPLNEAQEILREYMQDDYSGRVVNNATNELEWHEEFYAMEDMGPGYYSPTVRQWNCAAGADCWYGYMVMCDGTVEQWSGGEE